MSTNKCKKGKHLFDFGGFSLGKYTDSNNKLTGIGKAAIGASVASGLSNVISGGNQSGLGNFVSGAGAVAQMIPGPYGQAIGAGLQLLGSGINATFGSNINKKFVSEKENDIMAALGGTSSANNSEDFMSDFGNMDFVEGFTKGDVGTEGIFSNKATNMYKKLKAATQIANDTQLRNYNEQGENINMDGTTQQLLSLKSFGGNLNTQWADFSNGLQFIDEGGTHAQNPYNGVLMGMAPDGQPNLVEEGEVVRRDGANGAYVFSNRLKVEKGIRDKYKLSKNATYAKAVRKLSKESEERPNDPISKNGLNVILDDLTYSQEMVRMKKRDKQMQAQNAAYGGKLYDGGGYLDGLTYSPEHGYMYIDENGTIRAIGMKTPEEALRAAGINYRGYREPRGLPDFDLITPHEFDNDPIYQRMLLGENNYTASPQRQAAAPATSTGSDSFETDGVFDGDGNLITGTSATAAPSAPASKRKATGSKSVTQPRTIEHWSVENNPYYVTPMHEQVLASWGDNVDTPLPPQYTAKGKPAVSGNGVDDLQTWTRYAPIAGNALGLLYNTLSGPDESYADAIAEAARPLRETNRISWRPVGTELNLTPYDINYAADQILGVGKGANSYARNFSNGNVGAAMNNILTGTYNTQLGIGNAYRQGQEINNANRKTMADFYLNRDLANSQGFLNADARNQMADIAGREAYFKGMSTAAMARQRAKEARDAAISTNATALFNGLGAIGNENWARNDRNRLITSGVFGTLNVKPQDWSDERWNAYQASIGKACGGRIKTRKRGLTY